MATRHKKEVAKARALNISKVCLGFNTPRAFELGETMGDGDSKVGWLAYNSSEEDGANTSFLLAGYGCFSLRFVNLTVPLFTFAQAFSNDKNVA